MSAEEIKAKIESLENERFYLAMKDRWSSSDYRYDSELRNKINALKAQLEEVEA